MTHTYNIAGMTCNNCVAKVKSTLLKLADITNVDVKLEASQAVVDMQNHVSVNTLQTALQKAGNFTITEADGGMHNVANYAETASWFNNYKPILVIGAYITGITLVVEVLKNSFNLEHWMQNFMAAFFLVFSFFKMLDLKGFAEGYSTYDIIAKNRRGWGYVYAFIELGLGIAYLLKFNALFTNVVTFIVMSISIIGVLQSVLNKRRIRCACLGAVFNLPMSTVTVIEDALMIGMSAVMLMKIL